jgi:hypothetical protein
MGAKSVDRLPQVDVANVRVEAFGSKLQRDDENFS